MLTVRNSDKDKIHELKNTDDYHCKAFYKLNCIIFNFLNNTSRHLEI